jgi:hypothetical protein
LDFQTNSLKVKYLQQIFKQIIQMFKMVVYFLVNNVEILQGKLLILNINYLEKLYKHMMEMEMVCVNQFK